MEQIKGTVNRVELVGWVGAEPEQRFIPSGSAVCTFRVTTNRFAGRNEAGERLVEAEWTTVEAWEKLAESAGGLFTRAAACVSPAACRPNRGNTARADRSATRRWFAPRTSCS